MKQNPSRVTMFGASHRGRILTNAFHFGRLVFKSRRFDDRHGSAYPGTEDILGNGRFVDGRVFVRAKMEQCIV